MHEIKLENYRNFVKIEFLFDHDKNIIVIAGDNGTGKTNLLEAIHTISSSCFGASEQDKYKIHFDSEFSYYRISAKHDDNEIELISGRVPKINDVQYKKMREARALCPKVLFFRAKDSMKLIRGYSSHRRDWLDDVISALNPQYMSILKKYNKTLDQKNALLKNAYNHEFGDLNRQLDVWDEELCKYCIYITNKRKKLIDYLQEPLNRYFCDIINNNININLLYISEFISLESNEVLDRFRKSRNNDIRRNSTQVGSHKDDLQFLYNNKDMKYYTSQGQQKIAILSLFLAACESVKSFLSEKIIVLLDDVFSDLSIHKQEKLLNILSLQDNQIFITTQDYNNINNNLQIINL